ncbi:condensation domain-containing protein [Aquiflexum sp.]|uniref:condensation domain-containing protein n=1 Tax=Aquiflexum sp. TaxID=1872584 RepID=UPI003594858E
MSIIKNPYIQLYIKESSDNIKYWKSIIHGMEPLKLPKDPFGPSNGNGGLHKIFYPKDSISIEKLKNLTDESSILCAVIGSLQVLLYRYCNQNDFCVGLSLDGAYLNEFAKHNGFKIDLNPLPVRTQIDSGLTFDRIIQNSKEAVFEALVNSNVTFEELIKMGKNEQLSDFFFNVLCILKKEHV